MPRLDDNAALRVTSPATATGTDGFFFSYFISGINGVATTGATGLPSWLTYTSFSNRIGGVPPGPGTYYVTVFVSDNAGRTAKQNVTITITPYQRAASRSLRIGLARRLPSRYAPRA